MPPPLVQQLRDGGRLVAPVGQSLLVQKLKVLVKSGEELREEYVLDCVFVPMTGKHGFDHQS